MIDIIQACWIGPNDFNAYCEYCPSRGKKTYLPLHKTVLSPAHICEQCAVDYNIIGWYDSEKEYWKELEAIQEDQ